VDQESTLQRIVYHLRREWQIYLMLLPTIVWFIVFLYKPMYGLQIAFKDYSIFRGVANSPWIGLEHFSHLFSDEQFTRAFWNTIKISALNLLFGFPAPIILALMFNEVLHATYKKTAQTIVYLPHFISSVIIAGIVITAFSPSVGIVNTVLGWFGIDSIYFLTKPEWFRPIFVGTGIWQEAGFGSIVFLAAIAGVNPSLYESAVVDGANRWQMMWRITIPSILPTIIIMFIIRVGNVMEVSFELIIRNLPNGRRCQYVCLPAGIARWELRFCRRCRAIQRSSCLRIGDGGQYPGQALFTHIAVVGVITC